MPLLDDDEAVMNLLASEYLSFRSKDAFDQLGVKPDVPAAPLQKAFLQKCAALSPTRFAGADAKTKAEVLLMVYARTFGALSDPEQRALHLKRREHHEAARRAGGAPPKGRRRAVQDSHRTARRPGPVRRGPPTPTAGPAS